VYSVLCIKILCFWFCIYLFAGSSLPIFKLFYWSFDFVVSPAVSLIFDLWGLFSFCHCDFRTSASALFRLFLRFCFASFYLLAFLSVSALAFCERIFSTLAFSGRIFGALISFSFFEYFSIAACFSAFCCLLVFSTLIVQLPHPILWHLWTFLLCLLFVRFFCRTLFWHRLLCYLCFVCFDRTHL